MAGNGNSGRPGTPAALKLLQGNRGRENVSDLLAQVAARQCLLALHLCRTCFLLMQVAEWGNWCRR